MTTTSPTTPRPQARTTVARRSPVAVWWRAYRHHLRLARNAALAWIAGLTALSAGVAVTVEDRVGSEAERQLLESMHDVPAFEALQGRMVEIGTMEGFTLARWGMFGILLAVWAMLAAVSLLRRAEERGHVEPLRAGVLTPRGLLAAATAALWTWLAVLALAIGASHSALGFDPPTAWALGGAAALLGASFAAAGALASQLAATRGSAVALAGTLLGAALAVRVAAPATTTPDWLWWATPFGWMGFLHPSDASQATVLLALAALAAVLALAALALGRRDLHAGLVGGEEASAPRARRVGGQAGLALRVTAAAAGTWAIIIGVVTAAFGLLTHDFIDAMAGMATMVELGREMFGMALDAPEGMVGATFFFVAVLLAAAAAGQAAAIREEEASWRIEHLLARPVGRTRWLVTRLLVSAAALLAIALAGGVVAWAATRLGGASVALGDALLGAVNVVPVAWLTLGVGVAILGLAPRATAAATYGLVVAAFLLDFVGPFLELPERVLDASPLRHVAAAPGADVDVTAALVMLAVGIVAAMVGVLAFARRDLKEA